MSGTTDSGHRVRQWRVKQETTSMPPSQFTSDPSCAAATLVRDTTRQLKWECEQIQRLRSEREGSRDRAELLALAGIIQDLPRRQENFTQARAQFQSAYDKRVREKLEAD